MLGQHAPKLGSHRSCLTPPPSRSRSGLSVRFHVDADESGGSVSVFECDVPANARMPAPHSHDDFDETVFGLDGVTTFTVGGANTDLNPGEGLFIPRRVIHGFSNGGDVDARFLAVISPGLLASSYFREVADVLADGGPPGRRKDRRSHAPSRPDSRTPGLTAHVATPEQRARLLRSWCGSGDGPPHCRNGARPAAQASGGHHWGGTVCRLPPRSARRTGGTRQPTRP
jgi:quercetin dioxygenase-like cupin family protein